MGFRGSPARKFPGMNVERAKAGSHNSKPKEMAVSRVNSLFDPVLRTPHLRHPEPLALDVPEANVLELCFSRHDRCENEGCGVPHVNSLFPPIPSAKSW